MPQLTWLVTGCSSGFGREFVHQILSRGDNVIATARRLESIEDLKNAGATTIELDVTYPQETIDQIIAQALSVYGHIDVLVNNAGFVTSGSWEDLKYEDFFEAFNTNVFGPIKVTRSCLPHFRQMKSGILVFISSLSGWVGHQFTAAYAGSKFALEGVVESLHNETKSLGIRTLLMEPGRFRTSLLSTTNLKSTQSQLQEYEAASATHCAHLKSEDYNQPGDPRKFVKLVLDLVRQEGCAKGKNVPFRLPVGRDAVEEIGLKLSEMGNVLEEWDSIISSTDY